MRHIMLVLLAVCFLLVTTACSQEEKPEQNATAQGQALVDDWTYTGPTPSEDGSFRTLGSPAPGGGITKSIAPAPMMEAAMAPADNLGFSVGGAKDVANFRENVAQGYLPLPTDLTYEGLYYDYYFETGQQKACTALFCPSFAMAVSPDPFSGKEEYYLSVGLNSNLTEASFARKKLNVVVVLDISGSMGSPFDEYYYDQAVRPELPGEKTPGVEEKKPDPDASKTKMQLADKAVTLLMDHLKPGDRFGVVLFDDQAYLAKGLNPVAGTDMAAIKGHVLEIGEQGGTNMEAGMAQGSKLFAELGKVDPNEYENRIIFLTDAMPNMGDTSEEGLLGMIRKNAGKGVYTTFIGIGVDFNSELVEALSKVTGANYYSVHSAAEFKTRMDDEFEFMVTPLVFDLTLTLTGQGFDIEKVYGSPQADEATGEIMRVATLFPSRTEEGQTRGGLVLLKLRKTSDDAHLTLSTSYKDRNHVAGGQQDKVVFRTDKEFYDNNGIRKGIALTRYANLLKNWMGFERTKPQGPKPEEVYKKGGIPLPPEVQLGQWERTSMDLAVSPEYKTLFRLFRGWMEKEMKAVDDKTMQQEIDLLTTLINHK